MANETKTEENKQLLKAIAEGRVEQARVETDGTIIVPRLEEQLQSVDIADIDLVLGFSDGTFIIISNGALDAASNTPHNVVFNTSRDSLDHLFKLAGHSNPAKAGSLRVVTEHVDAARLIEEDAGRPTQEESDLPAPPAPIAKVSAGASLGKGPGKGPGMGGSGEGEGEVPEVITPLATPQPPIYRIGTKPQVSLEAQLEALGLGTPNTTVALYTSSQFKVTPSGRSDLPLGAYDASASTDQLAERSSPSKQATVEIINGTSGDDTINTIQTSYWDSASQWSKNLHLTINNFSSLDSIQLVFNDSKISQLPGFSLVGLDGAVVTRDGATSNSWHVTPTADMLLNGVNVAIVYNVNDNAAAVDDILSVNIIGHISTIPIDLTSNFNMSWREALTAADYLDAKGNPLMVLPRDGVGVEVFAGDGNDTINTGAGPDIIHGGAGNDTINAGSGNDILEGGLGGDIMDGGQGTDSAIYTNAALGVTASLTTGLHTDPTNMASPLLTNTNEAAGDTYAHIENLTGSAFDDILIGNSQSNVLTGGTGNDKLIGYGEGENADTLDGGDGTDTASYEYATYAITASLTSNTATHQGEAGVDTFISIENLIGGAGNDTFTGAAGIQANAFDGQGGSDTVSYAPSTAGVVATLDPTILLHPLAQTNDAAGDTFVSIENLTGTAFDDTLIGNNVANVLKGGDGNDILEGLGGADTFDGGAGSDTVSYANSTLGVVSSLTTVFSSGPAVTQTNDALGDTYSSIENIVGTGANDTLIGNSVGNTLTGGAGADVLEGMGGADILIGGISTLDINNPLDANNTASYAHASAVSGSTGITASLTTPGNNTGDAQGDTYYNIQNLTGSVYNDTLIGDSANNILIGGDGNDVLEGMAGADALYGDSLAGSTGGTNTASYEHASTLVTASLTTPAINSGDAAGDTYFNIQNLTGSNFNDTLIGDINVNTLSGGSGDDILEGMGGADVLIGGAGNNTASYAHAALAVTASLTTPASNTNDAAGDTYSDIQNLTGSAFNDILSGDVGNNILTGGDGDDTLEGFAGADSLIGGNGIDTVSFAHASNYVVASLTTGLAGITQAGDAAGDTYDGIEKLIGSDYNDTLIGNSTANTILGGAGDDTMEGIGGSDTYDGGTGNNTVSYAHALISGGLGVTASLATNTGTAGDALSDTYTNIQNLTGSAFDDTLTGDANNNILIGGAGNDTLTGGAGTDTIYGGTGNDQIYDDGVGVARLYGEDGDDTFHISSADGASPGITQDIIDGGDKSALRLAGIWAGAGDTISWEAAGTNRIDVDMINRVLYARSPVTGNVISFSNIENFTVTGNNTIYATLDNYSNVIDATSNGTANIDYVLYQNALGSISVDLRIINGVNVTGGSSVLDNYNAATRTWTGTGDTLKGIERVYSGSYYADNLYGSDSVDNWLAGSMGADYLDGGTGIDTVYLDPGRSQSVIASLLTATQNSLMGIVMTDVAQGDVYVNMENLYSSGSSDILYGNAGVNVLSSYGSMEGFKGADTLTSLGGTSATASYANAGNADLFGEGITTATSLGVTANLTGAGFASFFSGASATSGLGAAVHNTGDALGDTYTGNMYGLKGSAFNDILIGNALNNTITGGDGNDLMEGLAGADNFNGGNGIDTVSYAHAAAGVIMDLGTSGLYIKIGDALASANDAVTVSGGLVTAVDTYTNVENIIGSIHNDTLAGNSLANTIEGGAGNDYLDGGANSNGYDIASYANAPGPVTVSLALQGSAQNTVNAGNDTLINFEGLLGSSSGDTLTGDDGNNWIDGGSGADTLNGGNLLPGHYDSDTLAYSSFVNNVTNEGVNVTLNGANDQGDTISNFENLTGSRYNDTLTGDANSNIIEGDLGDDVLDGGGYTDAGTGGIGDTVSYAHAASYVEVDLSKTTSQETRGAGLDTITNFQNLTGSDYGDTLTGNNSNNIITAGNGNDVLEGLAGADTFSGGDGIDTVSYAHATVGVIMDLGASTTHIKVGDTLATANDAVTVSGGFVTALDTYSSIENIIGSSHADVIYGDSGDNVISSGGNVDGGATFDYIDGGDGSDTITFADAGGSVTVNLTSHTASGAYGNVHIYNIENIVGSIYSDTLFGDTGNNIIEGGLGNDILHGGGGSDTASYSTATSGVTVSLAVHNNTAQDTGGAGNDILYYDAGVDDFFSNLTGSAYNDTLTGDDAANILNGGAGDDLLKGGYGADVLIGGAGSDTASYAGSALAVTVNLATGAASGGDAAGDTFSSIENLIGSSNNDTLTGDTSNNVIIGGLGDDRMLGGSGNDIIYANQGKDTAYGEANNDTFYVSSLSANQPTLIDGGARDAGNIQNHGGNVIILQDLVNGGSYTLASHLTDTNARVVNIDTLNIRDGVNTAITISSQDVRYMADYSTVNNSQLFVEANNGDTLNLSLVAGETVAVSHITSAISGNGTYTDYTVFNASNVQVAQIHWHSA